MSEITFYPKEPKNQNTTDRNLHYQFIDWKYCFKAWRRYNDLYPNQIQLVISTDPITSGYWIERINEKVGGGDYPYRGKQVDDLLKRISDEHQLAQKEERGVKFIL